jgi:hypothetical protein
MTTPESYAEQEAWQPEDDEQAEKSHGGACGAESPP